jgi:hypothetical protein
MERMISEKKEIQPVRFSRNNESQKCGRCDNLQNAKFSWTCGPFSTHSTGISRYTSIRFTIFRLYEIHKLKPVFQITIQFSLARAPSSRKLIVVPGASSREVMGN